MSIRIPAVPETATERRYTLAETARLVGISRQTLLVYQKHGLVVPRHHDGAEFCSPQDVTWLRCLRELIHGDKLSIAALKKLLVYAPCWEIKQCSAADRLQCRGLPATDTSAVDGGTQGNGSRTQPAPCHISGSEGGVAMEHTLRKGGNPS